MTTSKLPALHLYIGDLLKDPGFLICDWQAQNFWIRLLLHIHEMPIRGELRSLSGQPLTNAQIAKLCCMPTDTCTALLQELESNEVFSRVDGAIINRRMVKERTVSEQREIISQIRSENGTKGARARWQNDGKTMANAWQTGMANACDPDGKPEWQTHATNDFAIMAKDITESTTSMANACDDMAKVPAYSSSSSSSSSSSIKIKSKSTPTPLVLSPEELAGRFNAIPGVKPVKLSDGELPGTIREKARRRIKEHNTAEFWDSFLRLIQQSMFLTGKVQGRDGGTPFQASFDWVMGPKNFDKILAGTYSDQTPTHKKRILYT
jgi:hypothetical protein